VAVGDREEARKWKGHAAFQADCQSIFDGLAGLIEADGLSVRACEIALESARKVLAERQEEVQAAQQRRADMAKEREGKKSSAKKLREQVAADRQRRQGEHQAAVDAYEKSTAAARKERAEIVEQLDAMGVLAARDVATAASVDGTTRALAAAEEHRQALGSAPEAGMGVNVSQSLIRARTELSELGDLSVRDRETATAVARTSEALRAAEEYRGTLGEAPDVSADDEALTEERDEVKAQLDAMLDARAQHRQLADVIAEIDRLVARHAVLVAIEEATKRLRAEQVARQGGPLLDVLTTYLRAAGRSETPYITANRTSCEFGWVRREKREGGAVVEHRISIAALSGGEWALYAAGLTAALLILRVAPVRILLIEGAEMDRVTLEQMLKGVAALKDELTACVCAAWWAEDVKSPGWTTMTASGERLAEAA
jgi:hypothetical protein